MAGRTVVGTTDRHGPFNEIESLNSVTEQKGRTIAVTMSRHRQRNPRLGRISLNVLRGVFDYSCYNYKFCGLMLIT